MKIDKQHTKLQLQISLQDISGLYYIADLNDEAKFQAYLSALPLHSLMTHHCGRKSKWYNVHLNPSIGDSPEADDLYEQFEAKPVLVESEGKEAKPSNETETAFEKPDSACEVIVPEVIVEPMAYRKSMSVDSYSSTYDTLSDLKEERPGRAQREPVTIQI